MATATLAVRSTAPVAPLSPIRPAGDLLGRHLLAVAWEPGAAPPREIRVRPELLERLAAQPGGTIPGLLGDPAGVPLVADPALPRSPGFEVRRVPPR
ncbi:hypothetical protein SAMN04488107_2435 [Geodermatophilus saharensis]|uniref:Uncharacterized protein n=1 Tax=Geodermatophilus saharensis TaxID=1137994 RepID=A0A239EAF4_9ACTN|nr:hypothetical protein [Geodermatophilus saharensis]SNS40892.1 hypothetical protein SAMN04488107_2435 [Geodermatophilus saharensis]